MKHFAALFLLLFSLPAFAQDAPAPVHALAMHGDPKYPADFTHFDYVNAEAPKGGTLKMAAIGTFDSLNPYIIKGVPAAGTPHIYESLLKQSDDEHFTMYGLLAKSIEMPEDRSWVIFNLHKTAKWHDGQPLVAEDVVWSFNTLIEKGKPFFRAYYGNVETVEALSETRVKFTFNTSENLELPLIIGQMPVFPKHIWTADGMDFGKTSLDAPVGSGPYKVAGIVPGRSISYVRDEDYWGKDLPINRGFYNFDRIQYDYYKDSNVALEAFLGGAYDFRLENTAKLWATAYDSPAVTSGKIIKETLSHELPQGIQMFAYNTRREVFSDPKVREALAYAFDFEWSNRQFAFDSYTRARSYFSNSDMAAEGTPEGAELAILEPYRDQLPSRLFTQEYNPPKTDGSGNLRANLRKATKLLDAAGYVLGADGIRTHKDTGQKLSFEFIVDNTAFERWITPFTQNLKKIGVEASFRTVDPAQYQSRMNDYDFDMTVELFPQSNSPGNEQREFWGSDKADVPGSRNVIGVRDPVVDALIEGVIRAPDAETLTLQVKALDRVLQWGFYGIPNWYLGAWRVAYDSKLQHPENLPPYGLPIEETWWVGE